MCDAGRGLMQLSWIVTGNKKLLVGTDTGCADADDGVLGAALRPAVPPESKADGLMLVAYTVLRVML